MGSQSVGTDGRAYLAEAESAWRRIAFLRVKRDRCKNYAYGNQWCDYVTTNSGATTEYDAIKAKGKEPLSNNMIRQLVKSVIGRFRESRYSGGDVVRDDLDFRALDEIHI